MKNFALVFFGLAVFAVFGFVNLEPNMTQAAFQATSTVSLTVISEISLTGCGNITMDPAIGLTQDASIGSSTCSVETSDADGYTLSFKSTSSPALVSGGNSFSDDATSTPTTWSDPGSGREFGFSVYGANTVASFGGVGTNFSCGTVNTTSFTASGTMKYLGFTTTGTTTTDRSSETTGAENTVLCVTAEQGASNAAPSGVYTATIVATATTK